MNRAIFVALVAGQLLWTGTSQAAANGLKGDPEAIALAEKLVESVGGHDLWANARSLYVLEQSFHPSVMEPIEAEFWRDLEEPAYHYTLKNSSIDNATTLNAHGYLHTVRGEVREHVEGWHEDELAYWPGEIYVMYHRLAKRDPDITLSLAGERRFSAKDADGASLGWFQLNVAGELILWNRESPIEGDFVEYVYGPKKSFGPINFPAWGSMSDGSWRFNYLDVRILAEPVDTSRIPSKD